MQCVSLWVSCVSRHTKWPELHRIPGEPIQPDQRSLRRLWNHHREPGDHPDRERMGLLLPQGAKTSVPLLPLACVCSCKCGFEPPLLSPLCPQTIREVTGYVLIAMNHFQEIPLWKLRVIRGNSLYDRRFALSVFFNYPKEGSSGLQQLGLSNLTGKKVKTLVKSATTRQTFWQTKILSSSLKYLVCFSMDWIFIFTHFTQMYKLVTCSNLCDRYRDDICWGKHFQIVGGQRLGHGEM